VPTDALHRIRLGRVFGQEVKLDAVSPASEVLLHGPLW